MGVKDGSGAGLGPELPEPRGEISAAVVEGLRTPAGARSWPAPAGVEPLGEDLQLALYTCYELHYRGFEGVEERWEWETGLLNLRAGLEDEFERALREEVGPIPAPPPEQVGGAITGLIAGDDGPELSRYIELEAGREEVLEFVVHRSAYQLKEADPHSWAIPRLEGPPKAALVEVQADEYGGGRAQRMHAELFAKTMRALELDDSYGAYLNALPATTLATVNLMSLCGLHRRLRGAIAGHLATFEATSPLPNRRYGNALRRLGYGAEATDFFDEHVEADSVHENIAIYDLAEGLARQDPRLGAEIVFGAAALLELDRRFAEHLLACWRREESSLRPAPAPVP
jgi:hypothetical protein